MISIPNQVKYAINMLESSGFEAFIVGGCVRDFLMGNEPHDFDITTSALPNETKKVFSSHPVIETGIKHGTVTVLIDHMPIEITTYRVDTNYSNHRHPDNVSFTKSLFDDIARRDFTMNAIAYNEKFGLIDCFDGEADIKRKTVRCVGIPSKRFDEDALRILRAIRFSSQLSFSLDENTHKAVIDQKHLLNEISVERIANEFTKILRGKNVASVIVNYCDVISEFIPNFNLTKDIRNEKGTSLLEEIAYTVSNVNTDADVRIASFLLKADEFTNGANQGEIKIADIIMKYLKLSNLSRKNVCSMIEISRLSISTSDKFIKDTMNRYSPKLLLAAIEILKARDNYFEKDISSYLTIENSIINILERNECFSISQLDVNGNDIVEFGISGKEVGDILSFLLDEVITNKVENKKTLLLKHIEKYR